METFLNQPEASNVMLEEMLIETMRTELRQFPLYHGNDPITAINNPDTKDEYSIRGELLGLTTLVIYVSPDVLHIMDIAIPDVFQGKGYGRTLLRVTENIARAWGCKEVHLSSFENVTGFYEKCGYKQIEFPKNTILSSLMSDQPFFMKDIAQSLKTPKQSSE
jgi:N-acetylglutamate synthase-like GNAT family acetyltransferase